MLGATEVAWLLDKLCVDVGLCLAPSRRQELQQNPPLDPITFTDAVFLAEGLDPSMVERHLYRQVHSLISQAFSQRGIIVPESTPNNRSRGP